MTPGACVADGGAAILLVRVTTRASTTELVGIEDGAVRVRLTAAPVDGAANAALITLLSGTFRLPTSRVTIVSGQTSRTKRVRLSDVSCADLLQAVSR